MSSPSKVANIYVEEGLVSVMNSNIVWNVTNTHDESEKANDES